MLETNANIIVRDFEAAVKKTVKCENQPRIFTFWMEEVKSVYKIHHRIHLRILKAPGSL